MDLLRYVRGETSREENLLIEKWLEEDAEHEKNLRQVAGIYHALKTKESIERRDPTLIYRKVEEKRRRKRRRVLARKISISAAACVLAVSFGLNMFHFNETVPHAPQTQYITVETNTGMRSRFALPDGTQVWLNSSSRLTYPIPFEKRERRVSLEGEGYFEVSENREQPFIVSTTDDRMRVKVLGTKFNVNAYRDVGRVYTTLTEGSVLVQFTDASGGRDSLSNHRVIKEQLLNPAERVAWNLETNKYSIQRTNPLLDCSWKDGKLIFKDTPMPEVLYKTANFFNVSFEVEDSTVNIERLTGVFDEHNLQQFLHYLEISSQVYSRIIIPAMDDSSGDKRTKVILSSNKSNKKE